MSKRKQGEVIRSKERKMVLNVFEYFKTRNPDKSVSWVVSETAEATGISEKSVYSIRRQSSRGPVLTPSKKRQRKRKQKNSRELKYDEFTRSCIRRKVHSFFLRNQPPTLNAILAEVNKDPDLPDFKKTTLNTLLKEMGFEYNKRGNKSIMIERPDILAWRRDFLIAVKRFRKQGKNIFYTDESWINTGTSVDKAWTDTTVKTPKQAFLAGLSVGLKPPTARGPRFALVHTGNEDGFLANAQLVFLCKKNTADAHDEMDGETYEAYFRNQVLPNLPPHSVVVIDNASYHSRKVEAIPTMAWRRNKIIEWITQHGATYEPHMLKKHLLAVVGTLRPLYDKYVIDEMAKEKGHIVLRLPPYHCELNPIELVWAKIKGHVKMNNTTFKTKDMQPLIQEGFRNVSPELWKSCVEHVKKVEVDMWRADDIQDDIEPFVINLADAESSSSVSEDDVLDGIDPLQYWER